MTFKDKLGRRELCWGPFIVSANPTICEALARTDIDVGCLDAEHGPYDRASLSACILALKVAQKDVIVRVAANTPEQIGWALDCGADAILCPHISTADQARKLVQSARFSSQRGFAGSTRAAGYGARPMADYLKEQDDHITVIAQIEDVDAVDNIDAILDVDGLDAIFIGRSDLTVSMRRTDRSDPDVIAAVEHIAKVAHDKGCPVGTFTTDMSEIPHWRSLGIQFYLLGSDLGLMVSGVNSLSDRVKEAAED